VCWLAAGRSSLLAVKLEPPFLDSDSERPAPCLPQNGLEAVRGAALAPTTRRWWRTGTTSQSPPRSSSGPARRVGLGTLGSRDTPGNPQHNVESEASLNDAMFEERQRVGACAIKHRIFAGLRNR
jgi:hypothetical protein